MASPAAPPAASLAEGAWLHGVATRLFPVCRSLTGDGVRETLAVLAEYLPGLVLHEVPSGTPAFDWTVPDEWSIRGASLDGPGGDRVLDFADCNLHVVGYSEPVDARLGLDELQGHLYSRPDLPDAIPYATSYYHRTWGLCLADRVRTQLREGEYHVVIDSALAPGSLTYAELVIPGELPAEVLVSTYVCHPSMANNELSGPMVSLALARWLGSLPERRFTYRFVFIPETIGSLTYLSLNLEALRSHVIAGLNLTCIGDDGDYSYLPTRSGSTAIDRIARRAVLARERPVLYTFLDRGSDERQYCAPGVDLPVASLMRTKYGRYREYHTSLDDLAVVTPSGLQGGLDLARDVVLELESSEYYRSTVLGEPQLGRRGLYHSLLVGEVDDVVRLRTDILAFCDGHHSTLDLAELCSAPLQDIEAVVGELAGHGLLERIPAPGWPS